MNKIGSRAKTIVSITNQSHKFFLYRHVITRIAKDLESKRSTSKNNRTQSVVSTTACNTDDTEKKNQILPVTYLPVVSKQVAIPKTTPITQLQTQLEKKMVGFQHVTNPN